MKGQFFLVGAFLLIVMFYIGISVYITPSFAKPSLKESTENLFDNIKNEYPRALNLGLSGSHVQAMEDFTNFAANLTRKMNADLRVLWVITENVSDNLNVTVGNFFGSDHYVTINVSGEVKVMHVPDSGINSTLFTSTPAEFRLGLNFNTTQKNVLLEKYKVNLYSILEMAKGTDRITGEIKA